MHPLHMIYYKHCGEAIFLRSDHSRPRYGGYYYDTISSPDQPDVYAYADVRRRVIYVNRAAKSGANVVDIVRCRRVQD